MGLTFVNNGPAAVCLQPPHLTPLVVWKPPSPFQPPKARRKLCYPVLFQHSKALPVFPPHFLDCSLFFWKNSFFLFLTPSPTLPPDMRTHPHRQPLDTMGRIPRTSKALEETSYFAAPTKPSYSYEDELHALKLKHKLPTHETKTSFLWRAATKLLHLPTAFFDLFRPCATVEVKKEPLRRSARLSNKEDHQDTPQAISLPNPSTVRRVCRSTFLGLLVIAFIMLAQSKIFGDKKGSHGQDRQAMAEHNARVQQARDDAWHVLDWRSEAYKELMAAKIDKDMAEKKGASIVIKLARDRVKKAQLKYDEVNEKHEEIKAALEAEGLYPEFKIVSSEEYEAQRAGRPSDYYARGRAAVEAHFPCTPSRDAELKEKEEQDGLGGESPHKTA